MIFTCELKGIDKLFRLQKDKKWRRIGNDISILDSDFYTKYPDNVELQVRNHFKLVLDDVLYKINPVYINPGVDNVLSLTSRVFRRECPVSPSFDQLLDVIEVGDDSQHNSLILNVYGLYELRSSSFNGPIDDPTVVVRFETYIAGNGYVGESASSDMAEYKEEYWSSLEYWINHLKTRETSKYCDYPMYRSFGEMHKELTVLEDNWIPQY